MVRVIGLFLLCAVSLVAASEPGVTGKVEPAEPGVGMRLAVPGTPPPITAPSVKLESLPSDSGWTLIDSMVLHKMIPAGERLAVVFDSATELLRDTLLPVYLTEAGRQAVEVAPDWLKDDLADNLRRIGPAQQDRLTAIITNCPDKRYYDELCFQLAHLSATALLSCPPQLLVDNVQQAYQIDRELQYVDIVDYGDPLQGGDYYSTTKYRTLVQGETTWVEIPRDIYYWWVVMPKGTDEPPAYVMGYFWREYLFYHNDSGYPLLREKLAPTRLFWDGRKQLWGGGFDDTMPAVAVVGRWAALTMPFPAEGNRPIQPVDIAREHNGNCGEMQDLLQAAARTALIPCGGVLDINEDHVWNEVWWDSLFIPYANDPTTHIADSGVAYERKYGGGKNCSGIWDWRNDGWQRSVIGTYSDVCTLTVQAYDSCRRPAAGQIVQLSSEDWYGGVANCFFGVTDRYGRYTTTLGDQQNYYLTISGPAGRVNAGKIIDSAAAAPGASFFYACSLSGRLDSLAVLPDSGAPLEHYRIDVGFSSGREVLYGSDCYNASGANEYALVSSPGHVDFFLVGRGGFDGYRQGAPFAAFVNDEDVSAANHSLVLSRTGNHYAVFSNDEQPVITTFVDATLKLYRRGTGVMGPQKRGPLDWAVFGASPFRGRFIVRLRSSPAGARFTIHDRAGRVVRVVPAIAGSSELAWDGTDQTGTRLPAGVYFCQIAGGRRSVTRPIVYLGSR